MTSLEVAKLVQKAVKKIERKTDTVICVIVNTEGDDTEIFGKNYLLQSDCIIETGGMTNEIWLKCEKGIEHE